MNRAEVPSGVPSRFRSHEGSSEPVPRPAGKICRTAPGLMGGALMLLGCWIGGTGFAGSELEWQSGAGYRRADLTVPAGGRTGFTLVDSRETGIMFTNFLSEERSLLNQVLLNGSGVAAGDMDGDGLADLYFCGLDADNVLYRNLGNWRFEDVTEKGGVACAGQDSSGAAFADINGNGRLDLLVNGIGAGTRLFLNNGGGQFREATDEAGLQRTGGGSSLALADIDGDGFLDLYVVNYRTATIRDQPDTKFSVSRVNNQVKLVAVNGRPVTAPDLVGRFTLDPQFGVMEHGEADVFYRNDGQGRFVPLDWTGGTFLDEAGEPVETPYDWGLAAMFRDLTGNGAPDLYVCNDFQSKERIWLNDGQGRFQAAPRLAFRQTSLFSMGVDFADLDRNGRDDIFVVDMLSRRHEWRQVQLGFFSPFQSPPGVIDNRPQYSRNTLFWNRGDGTFAETAFLSGLEASDWSWCPVFLDVDLNGYEDILVVTGHARDAQNIDIARQIEEVKRRKRLSPVEQLRLRRMFPKLEIPNYAFRNRGDLTFEEVGADWGFDSTRISQGIGLVDLDNDGDLDVVINCLNDAPLIYRNDSPAPRLAVRLRGLPPNTQGIGARIKVRDGPVPEQSQEVIAGGRYLAADDPMRVFAAGTRSNELAIEVLWRSGRRSLIQGARGNRIYEISEPDSEPARPPEPAPKPLPLFADVSNLIEHVHHDQPFNDFERQPLLPRKLSHLGPGVTWFDWNGNGWDDLIIGGGKGGRMAVYLNNGSGGFAPIEEEGPWNRPVTRDQTTVLGWTRANGERLLLAGSSNYEDGLAIGPSVRLFDLTAQSADDSFPAQISSTGPLAMADMDGNGRLDLFVGGRVVPGRYPEPASSLLFRNVNGRLQLDEKLGAVFQEAGLVSGAIWTDLDGDGLPELVLACEGGPIRVFRRSANSFEEITESLGLDRHVGWWNSVAAGDFTGDGRLDLVAGNWGRNTRYQNYRSEPLQLFFGDVNGNGFVEVIEAYHDPGLGKVVPWRDWRTLSQSLPFLTERYGSFTEFSTASVSEFMGEEFSQMNNIAINTLETMIFLNRGDHFEARPLPLEAQLAPVFGLVVGDLDGDGNEDLFLSQNFFGVALDQSRHDAGRGLVLRGDGRGGFQPLPAWESGIEVYGEGRGAALSDFDGDGRVDLAVAQNGNATRLFRNIGARPGLRVRLEGPPGNPQGIGAAARVVYAGGKLGPARELRAGGGYWSQDSAVMVLGLAEPPEAVAVTWPGGEKREYKVPKDASEIVLSFGAAP